MHDGQPPEALNYGLLVIKKYAIRVLLPAAVLLFLLAAIDAQRQLGECGGAAKFAKLLYNEEEKFVAANNSHGRQLVLEKEQKACASEIYCLTLGHKVCWNPNPIPQNVSCEEKESLIPIFRVLCVSVHPCDPNDAQS